MTVHLVTIVSLELQFLTRLMESREIFVRLDSIVQGALSLLPHALQVSTHQTLEMMIPVIAWIVLPVFTVRAFQMGELEILHAILGTSALVVLRLQPLTTASGDGSAQKEHSVLQEQLPFTTACQALTIQLWVRKDV